MQIDRNNKADAWLAHSQREQSGRLTIFLGAAPGVGKTYAMLQAAQAQLRQGVDLRAGVVETHGRAETAALLEGLESLPLKQVEYRGRMLSEFDLDAALARKPAILLVDELAHSNVQGSRHAKRWQDVQELLDAGIDVYTTVNVQHLEALNDQVRDITGVQVRETLPDWVLQEADEILLIDLPPRELLEREEALEEAHSGSIRRGCRLPASMSRRYTLVVNTSAQLISTTSQRALHIRLV